jgi:hypothetical protein
MDENPYKAPAEPPGDEPQSILRGRSENVIRAACAGFVIWTILHGIAAAGSRFFGWFSK